MAAYVFDGTQVIGQARGADSSVYHHDHLSARTLTSNTGAIQASYSYGAFGELTREWGATTSSAPTVANPHRFAGERFNADSGMYYLRARWMDPRMGRFSSVDPLDGDEMEPCTAHDYRYAGSDPINAIDPTGQFTLIGVEFPQRSGQLAAEETDRVPGKVTRYLADENRL